MNWYKKASLYEEIKRYGPEGQDYIDREPINRRLKELGG